MQDFRTDLSTSPSSPQGDPRSRIPPGNALCIPSPVRRFPSPPPGVFTDPEGFPCPFHRHSRCEHPPGKAGHGPGRAKAPLEQLSHSPELPEHPRRCQPGLSHCHGNRIPAPGTLITLGRRSGPSSHLWMREEGWEARNSIPVELREAGKPREEEEEGKIKRIWKTTTSPAGMNTALCPAPARPGRAGDSQG